jgi:hypothetical protein
LKYINAKKVFKVTLVSGSVENRVSGSDSQGSAASSSARRGVKLSVQGLLGSSTADGSIVDIEDSVYRVFNKLRFEKNGSARINRIVVLGGEGSSVRIVFWDKSADAVDTALIQRKDRVIATNLRIKKTGDDTELHSTSATYISRLMPARSAVTDFSQLHGGEKNIDVTGRVVSVSPIRYFRDLSGKESGVSDCSISDGKAEIRMSLWGSSSICAGEMHPGDYIKAEFVSARLTDNGIEITANDSARLLLSRRQI